MKKVKVCKHCSNFDTKEIKEQAENMNCKLKFDCIGKCRKKCPELKDKYYGKIDGKLVVCSSKKEFFEMMK
ncbi:hypothetical protein EDD76_10126 [Kineothrix alysoides]|uniref:DUF1450 domain-containing protein n=1 Tax=Kineothrix alysoides TaxID=1469948 RepID=A0A4R1R5Z0_9FIRM|nr:hypothetical protein [Kineothrix alysoides]TCL60929.1 hypothetical protein EDD76_10126 [Kineothrix alysoides]